MLFNLGMTYLHVCTDQGRKTIQINVTPEDADVVYVSESGPPDARTAKKLDGRVYETTASATWFLGVDSKNVAATMNAPAKEWVAATL